jgi:predicted  nucleic acid-binding Zn-ribbon protein/Zn-dependent protease with chaperone function
LRNERPQARYAVSCIALALCLALPIIGVWRGMQADTVIAGTPVAAALATNVVDSVALPDQAPVARPTPWHSTLQGQLPSIVALWSLGAGLLALRMALGMMWVGRIGRSRTSASHPRWQRRLDRLAEKMDIVCSVRLRVTSDLASPVVAGCLKPVVLVPAALIANMPLDLLEALLAHELAHIRRHDYLVNLIQSAIESLLFYHPVVWWLSKQIRIEREQIADDLAARAVGDPRRLALALHELDQFQQDQIHHRQPDGFAGALDLVPAANGGHLMSRIQRLIRPNQHALDWKMALPIIGLAAVCVSVYAHDNKPTVANAIPTAATASTVIATTVAATSAETAASVAPAIATKAAATSAETAARIASVIATRAAVASAETAARIAPAIATMAAATSAKTAASTASVLAAVTTTTRISSRALVASASALHSRDDSYAIIRVGQDNMNMSGDSRDIPTIEKTKKNVHGDFVWVRRGDKAYVVQDPAIIAKVVEAWKPAEELGKQMDALGKQMDIPSKHMEELGKQMEAFSNSDSPYRIAMDKTSAQMDALGHQQEAIGNKMEALGNKMEHASDAEREVLDRQMQALEAQMRPIEQQMDKLSATMNEHGKEMEAAQKPMEDLGKQMEEAGKPMEALGKQMEVLGKQEEQLSHEADLKVRALIDEAMRSGKATPTGVIIQRD